MTESKGAARLGVESRPPERPVWSRVGTAFLVIFDIVVVIASLASQDLRLVVLALAVSLLIMAVWMQYLAREPEIRRRRTALSLACTLASLVCLATLGIITWRDSRIVPIPPFNPDVKSYEVETGHPHQIPGSERITQEFTAASSCLTQVAAIAGREGFEDGAIIGTLRFQLFADDGRTVWSSGDVRAFNNEATVVSVPQVEVTPGERYALRVINSSEWVLGIYTAERQERGLRTIISAEEDQAQPQEHDHEHSLSGAVVGISC